jgi:hypothetical protein
MARATKRRAWTKDDVRELKKHSRNKTSVQVISKTMKRTPAALRQKSPLLGQGYIGPDHRVLDMPSLFGALVQALQAAHQQGWKDRGARRS